MLRPGVWNRRLIRLDSVILSKKNPQLTCEFT